MTRISGQLPQAHAGVLPAEWSAQDGVLLAWPHAGTDWASNLAEVRECYRLLVGALQPFVRVLLLVANDDVGRDARAALGGPVLPGRLRLLELDYHDTWLRDSGPVTLLDEEGPIWLDFRFTGWGGKFAADTDDRLVAGLQSLAPFAHLRRRRIEYALEGGAIESDGAGSILTTWRCLAQRHGDELQERTLADLCASLGAERIIALEHGALEGDDTDAHIDTLARFASVDSIVYQGCQDGNDPHFPELRKMAEELAALRTPNGTPYHLFELPWAPPIHAADGRRLAASYANFLISNGAVFMPGYGVASDQSAAEVLAEAFPTHSIVPVPCRPLIEQNGSLHCITMQLPHGSVREI
jgi:agmatine/peptidylarginine deiminase